MAAYKRGIYDGAAGVRTMAADVRDISLAGVDAVFTDPARPPPAARGPGRRLRPGTSEPRWTGASPHPPGPRGGRQGRARAAGRDRPRRLGNRVRGRRPDLKEAVLWSPALATAPSRATILPGEHVLLPADGDEVPVAAPGPFLFDPNPAVTRAGLVEDLARQLGAWKIDPRIAFLSASTAQHTPFARTLRVVESAPWTRRTSPAGCAPSGSAPLTCAAAAWRATWTRSTAGSGWPGRTGPRSS